MRKTLFSFFVLSIFILNFVILSHASPEAKKNNTESTTKKEQPAKTKAKKHKWEFSISGALDVNKAWSDRYDYTDITTTIYIPARIGYFLTKNIEIEPEINIILVNRDGSSESQVLWFTNVAYNFSNSSQVTPFILGGVGIMSVQTRGIMTIPEVPLPDFTGGALNAGAGIKVFAFKRIAFRVEYRFIYYSRKYNGFEVDVYDYYNHHKVFMGISIFL